MIMVQSEICQKERTPKRGPTKTLTNVDAI